MPLMWINRMIMAILLISRMMMMMMMMKIKAILMLTLTLTLMLTLTLSLSPGPGVHRPALLPADGGLCPRPRLQAHTGGGVCYILPHAGINLI